MLHSYTPSAHDRAGRNPAAEPGYECARDRYQNHDLVGGLVHPNSNSNQYDQCARVVWFQHSGHIRLADSGTGHPGTGHAAAEHRLRRHLRRTRTLPDRARGSASQQRLRWHLRGAGTLPQRSRRTACTCAAARRRFRRDLRRPGALPGGRVVTAFRSSEQSNLGGIAD
jgi:hypothetical protein